MSEGTFVKLTQHLCATEGQTVPCHETGGNSVGKQNKNRTTPYMQQINHSSIIYFVALACLTLAYPCAAQPARGSLEKVTDEIRAYREKIGRAMNHTEFVDLISRPSHRLTGSEIAEAWNVYANTQRPVIKKADLIDLIQAKRDSLANYYCSSSVRVTNRNSETAFEQNVLAIDGNKIFFETKSDDYLGRVSFDGTYWKSVSKNTSKCVGDVIGDSSRRNACFKTESILASSMLLDSERDLGMPRQYMYDLILALQTPGMELQEQLVEYEGETSLVITDGVACVYLSTKRDYSVLGVAQYMLVRGPDDEITEARKIYERKMSDFVDCGNGMWLPQVVQIVSTDNGTRRVTLEVDKLTVNDAIPETIDFLNIFPQGTLVNDSVCDIVYTIGDYDEIENIITSAMNEDMLGGESGLSNKDTSGTNDTLDANDTLETQADPIDRNVGQNSKGSLFVVCFIILAGIIILSLLAVAKRGTSKKTSLVLLFVVLPTVFCQGYGFTESYRGHNAISQSTSCGPISLFIALRILDKPTTLEEITHQCEYRPDKGVTVGKLKEVLQAIDGIHSLAVRLNISQLKMHLKNDCVAILVVNSGGDIANHSVVAALDKNGGYRVFDYPLREDKIQFEDLYKGVWAGECLLLSRKPIDIRQGATCNQYLLPICFVLFAGLGVATAIGIRNRAARRIAALR